jgi:putative membrane protein
LEKRKSFLSKLLVALTLCLLWSFIRPHDTFTWFLEVFPIFIALPILVFTYKKFPFTNLVYIFIFLHMIILMVGGHYTYAEVPLFNWLRDYFDLGRNYYDRLGHFAQGFVPALIAREILIRKEIVKGERSYFLLCAASAWPLVHVTN